MVVFAKWFCKCAESFCKLASLAYKLATTSCNFAFLIGKPAA